MSTPTKTANGLDAARGGEEAYDAAQIEQLNSLLGFLESSSAAGSNDVKFQGLKQLGSLAAGSSGADLRGGSSAVSSGDGRNVAELPSLHRAASAATPERLSKMIPELAGGAGFVGAAPLAEDVGLGHGHPAGPAASGTSPAADIASLLQQQPGHGAEITKRTSSASYSSDGAVSSSCASGLLLPRESAAAAAPHHHHNAHHYHVTLPMAPGAGSAASGSEAGGGAAAGAALGLRVADVCRSSVRVSAGWKGGISWWLEGFAAGGA